jgi:hypothetical protein
MPTFASYHGLLRNRQLPPRSAETSVTRPHHKEGVAERSAPLTDRGGAASGHRALVPRRFSVVFAVGFGCADQRDGVGDASIVGDVQHGIPLASAAAWAEHVENRLDVARKEKSDEASTSVRNAGCIHRTSPLCRRT